MEPDLKGPITSASVQQAPVRVLVLDRTASVRMRACVRAYLMQPQSDARGEGLAGQS